MIHRSIMLVLAALAWLGTAQIGSVQAQAVSGVVVQNGSSGMPSSSPLTERYFETASNLGPVVIDDDIHSFTHRLAFHNSLVAGGGVTQVNKRNVFYQLTFTLDDPLGVGYQIDLTSVLRGVFVGTSTFSLHFTSVPTPTTNVVFQNESLGEGFVNYGLGSDVGDLEVSTDDLGHFLTIDVTFNADAVATAAETWSGVKSLFR